MSCSKYQFLLDHLSYPDPWCEVFLKSQHAFHFIIRVRITEKNCWNDQNGIAFFWDQYYRLPLTASHKSIKMSKSLDGYTFHWIYNSSKTQKNVNQKLFTEEFDKCVTVVDSIFATNSSSFTLQHIPRISCPLPLEKNIFSQQILWIQSICNKIGSIYITILTSRHFMRLIPSDSSYSNLTQPYLLIVK